MREKLLHINPMFIAIPFIFVQDVGANGSAIFREQRTLSPKLTLEFKNRVTQVVTSHKWI